MGLLPQKQEPPKPTEYLGQLAVDVFQDDTSISIIAPIAGVKIKDINITISDNVLKIDGSRMVLEPEKIQEYLIQECYWGPFSREIILPSTVDPSKVSAQFKDGILRVNIPRQSGEKQSKSVQITS
jgi:HSP20 family protein